MFSSALFTIAQIWEQPKCLLMDEWIKKMWYKYIQCNFFFLKEGNPAICDNMDEAGGHYVK